MKFTEPIIKCASLAGLIQGSSQSKATSAKTQQSKRKQRFRFKTASKDLALLLRAKKTASKDFRFVCLKVNSKGQNSSLHVAIGLQERAYYYLMYPTESHLNNWKPTSARCHTTTPHRQLNEHPKDARALRGALPAIKLADPTPNNSLRLVSAAERNLCIRN